jgi:ArsR family transcriptional regulator, arsenate/arsenite/antimonite-responsive transcriptional repressor
MVTSLSMAEPPAPSDAACCAPLPAMTLSQDEAVDLARVLKAVADPTRLRLLALLAASEQGELCVCDLTAPLGLSQPTISHHLKVLLEVGLVERETRGAWRYYRSVPAAMSELGSIFTTGPVAATA